MKCEYVLDVVQQIKEKELELFESKLYMILINLAKIVVAAVMIGVLGFNVYGLLAIIFIYGILSTPVIKFSFVGRYHIINSDTSKRVVSFDGSTWKKVVDGLIFEYRKDKLKTIVHYSQDWTLLYWRDLTCWAVPDSVIKNIGLQMDGNLQIGNTKPEKM